MNTFYKTISSLLLSSICLIPLGLQAGDKVDQSLAADADGIVEIQNIRGQIEIIGWQKNEVHLAGELDDLTDELIFEKTGKAILIKVKLPDRNVNHGDGSNLVIKVPMGNQIDFNGISTDIEIEGITGGVEIHSISGEVALEQVSSVLNIGTVSGDIKISKSMGKAKIDTVSGDIKASMDSTAVMANTVSGDIRLELEKYDKMNVSTVSGDIKVSGILNDSGKVRLNSVNGDINATFHNMINVRATIHTGPGGEIKNNLSDDKITTIFPSQQKLQMTLGDGSGALKISTVNGTIKLNGKN